MARRILLAVAAVLLIWFLWWGYVRYRDGHEMTSGDVVSSDPSAANERSRHLPAEDAAPAASPSKPIVYPPAQSSTPAAVSAPSPAVAANSSSGMDTLSPNPPNGMVFAGTGHFQIYRQGDLTWRVNTDDGHACILFATDEQWRKPRIYRNGCGSR